jgi:hypothetical protein
MTIGIKRALELHEARERVLHTAAVLFSTMHGAPIAGADEAHEASFDQVAAEALQEACRDWVKLLDEDGADDRLVRFCASCKNRLGLE